MAWKQLALTASLMASAPALASLSGPEQGQAAPAASESARYCLRIEAVTGTRVERVLCLTRAEWIEQDVDLDKEWPRDGVRVIG